VLRLALVLVSVLALGSSLSHAAGAEGGEPLSPADGTAERTTVQVGFFVYRVRDLDLKAGRVGLEFYMWFRFRGEGKQFEQIEFPNGRIDQIEEEDRRFTDGQTYICWRISGTFTQEFTLRDYPFDRQVLEIELEHPALESKFLVYAHDDDTYRRTFSPADMWGVRSGLALPDWRVLGVTRRVQDHVYETNFGIEDVPGIGSRYSQLSLAIRVERISAPFFYKIAIPIAIILAVAYLAFYIPPHELVAACLVAVAALVATVAYHTIVNANLPEVGYLTVSDKFFLTTLGLILLNLAESVATYNLVRTQREALARRIEVASRVLFPLVYLGAFAGMYLFATGR
jgi:hypothetical protein